MTAGDVLRLKADRAYTKDSETVTQNRRLAPGISSVWLAFAELCHARPGDDRGREGMLQEDGGGMWPCRNGSIAFLLPTEWFR